MVAALKPRGGTLKVRLDPPDSRGTQWVICSGPSPVKSGPLSPHVGDERGNSRQAAHSERRFPGFQMKHATLGRSVAARLLQSQEIAAPRAQASSRIPWLSPEWSQSSFDFHGSTVDVQCLNFRCTKRLSYTDLCSHSSPLRLIPGCRMSFPVLCGSEILNHLGPLPPVQPGQRLAHRVT